MSSVKKGFPDPGARSVRDLQPEELSEARQLWARGEKPSVIAARFGVHPLGLLGKARNERWPVDATSERRIEAVMAEAIQAPGRATPDEVKNIARDMFELDGISSVSIAKKLGLNSQTVSRWALREKWRKEDFLKVGRKAMTILAKEDMINDRASRLAGILARHRALWEDNHSIIERAMTIIMKNAIDGYSSKEMGEASTYVTLFKKISEALQVQQKGERISWGITDDTVNTDASFETVQMEVIEVLKGFPEALEAVNDRLLSISKEIEGSPV